MVCFGKTWKMKSTLRAPCLTCDCSHAQKGKNVWRNQSCSPIKQEHHNFFARRAECPRGMGATCLAGCQPPMSTRLLRQKQLSKGKGLVKTRSKFKRKSKEDDEEEEEGGEEEESRPYYVDEDPQAGSV